MTVNWIENELLPMLTNDAENLKGQGRHLEASIYRNIEAIIKGQKAKWQTTEDAYIESVTRDAAKQFGRELEDTWLNQKPTQSNGSDDGWVLHYGGGIPVAYGTEVEVVWASESPNWSGLADYIHWNKVKMYRRLTVMPKPPRTDGIEKIEPLEGSLDNVQLAVYHAYNKINELVSGYNQIIARLERDGGRG